MKLLCDANIGSRLAIALAKAGYDVLRSIHALSPDADDRRILAFAVAKGRIVITCDADFGELVFLHGEPAPPAIVYVRFEPEDVEEIIPRVIAVLQWDRIEGHMVVVGPAKDRMTAFPERS